MSLNLHIERLILEGLPLEWRERRALQAAIEQHLAHLFATRGMPAGLQSSNNTAALVSPSMQVDGDGGSRAMAMQIGDSLYAGLSPYSGAGAPGSGRGE